MKNQQKRKGELTEGNQTSVIKKINKKEWANMNKLENENEQTK